MILRPVRVRTLFLLAAAALMASNSYGAEATPSAATSVIKDGATVGIEYTLTLDDGTTVQSNVDGKPLSYVQGQKQIISGLESALAGHVARDRVKVKIPPAQAYGPVDPKAVREVPIDKVPEQARKAGAMLSSQGYDGPIRVTEVRKDVVVLDFNHPLAGKTLNFDVLILTVD